MIKYNYQKEKKRKEKREKVKKVFQWLGLILLACLVAPVLWLYLILMLSV